MTIRTKPWPTGLPCWADLTTPDMDAAKRFYKAVVGWDFMDTGEEFGGYSIAQVKGAAAAGVGPLQSPEMPSAWTLYFATDDIEKTEAQVAEAGGMVILPAGDVGGLGKMFIAADPTGAVFGVWQAGTHIGAGIVNEAGGLMWEDLRSPDPDAARTFYNTLFGYTYDPIPEAGDAYKTFTLPGEETPAGGMGDMMGMEGAPAHWLVYFGVNNAADAADACEANGGTIIERDIDTPYGTMVIMSDPAGAFLTVIEPVEGAPMPDRED
jgi:predicted enzyme related to lactoylglutathione lyase